MTRVGKFVETVVQVVLLRLCLWVSEQLDVLCETLLCDCDGHISGTSSELEALFSHGRQGRNLQTGFPWVFPQRDPTPSRMCFDASVVILKDEGITPMIEYKGYVGRITAIEDGTILGEVVNLTRDGIDSSDAA